MKRIILAILAFMVVPLITAAIFHPAPSVRAQASSSTEWKPGDSCGPEGSVYRCRRANGDIWYERPITVEDPAQTGSGTVFGFGQSGIFQYTTTQALPPCEIKIEGSRASINNCKARIYMSPKVSIDGDVVKITLEPAQR